MRPHPLAAEMVILMRCILCVALTLCAPIAANAEVPVSFTQEVQPILTRAGCNQGACHGTPTGKNGFRLSLRGYDPVLDETTLTREAMSRRLNPLQPDSSLLLLKGSGRVPHEGGVRLDRSRTEYALLRRWIAEGATIDRAAPALSRLEITPSQLTLEPGHESASVKVIAHLANQTSLDVTHLVRFSVNDETIASVNSDGIVRRRKAGEVAVAAEYRGQMVTSLVTFLPPRPMTAWARPKEHNFVDTHVLNKLELLRIEPSALCDDATFLRRLTLDLNGRLPTADELRTFIADPRIDKRPRIIDECLERDEFADFWAMKWTDRLGCNQRFVGQIGAQKYHAWIRQQIAANVGEDAFVRAILTSSGGNYSSPPVGFYRRLRDPATAAEEVAQLFLGVRMQCAKCHNHPGERWTQNDYYGMAAFFTRMSFRNGPFFNHTYDKEESLSMLRVGAVSHPRTAQVMPPKFLGGDIPVLRDIDDRRAVFAEWLTAPTNPFFAKAGANRIWYHLFGRGIVDPVDDLRSTNPPANAELLDALTVEFVKSKFNRKHLIRVICNSRTYQQSSVATATNGDDEKYFARARLRLLGAEQLLDAMSWATGIAEKFPGQPLGVRAIEIPDGETKHPFLEAFGRPARAMTCECERGNDTTLSQALHLVGGSTVQSKLRSDAGRVTKLIADGKSDAVIVEELFLSTLSRYPTEEEKALVLPTLRHSDAMMRRRAAEDLLWALINHREFVFQR